MSEQKPSRQLVRIIDVDIPGRKHVGIGMTHVKGISHTLAKAVCFIKKIDPTTPCGELTDQQLNDITEVLRDPQKFGIPVHMLNRRKDYDTGEDKHLVSTDIRLFKEFDIKRARMTKSYVGFRHGKGLPVRGQRTKAHFRKGKSLGVSKGKGKKGRV